MINVADINEYLKSIKSPYKLWTYHSVSEKIGDFVILDKFGDAILHLFRDRNTGKIFTEVWNRPPNLSDIFTYKRILSIKFKGNICNIFLLEDLRNDI